MASGHPWVAIIGPAMHVPPLLHSRAGFPVFCKRVVAGHGACDRNRPSLHWRAFVLRRTPRFCASAVDGYGTTSNAFCRLNAHALQPLSTQCTIRAALACRYGNPPSPNLFCMSPAKEAPSMQHLVVGHMLGMTLCCATFAWRQACPAGWSLLGRRGWVVKHPFCRPTSHTAPVHSFAMTPLPRL